MLRPLHRALSSYRLRYSSHRQCLRSRSRGSRNFSSPIHIRAAAESTAATRAQNKRPQDQAGAQRARWPAYNFPAPNGGLLVFTIMPSR